MDGKEYASAIGKLRQVAANLYKKPPENLSAFGLRPEDYAEEDSVKVFPQNVQSINVFISLGTQWLVGPGGPYGLNYQTLYHKLDRMNLRAEESARIEEDMRVLEDAALEQMRKDKD